MCWPGWPGGSAWWPWCRAVRRRSWSSSWPPAGSPDAAPAGPGCGWSASTASSGRRRTAPSPWSPAAEPWRAGGRRGGRPARVRTPRPGCVVEAKGLAVTVHWRRAPEAEEWATERGRGRGGTDRARGPPRRMSIELRPPLDVDKGTVVAAPGRRVLGGLLPGRRPRRPARLCRAGRLARPQGWRRWCGGGRRRRERTRGGRRRPT